MTRDGEPFVLFWIQLIAASIERCFSSSHLRPTRVLLSAEFAAHRDLRSASRGALAVPFARTSKTQRKVLSAGEPTTWNSLPSNLDALLTRLNIHFYKHPKTVMYM